MKWDTDDSAAGCVCAPALPDCESVHCLTDSMNTSQNVAQIAANIKFFEGHFTFFRNRKGHAELLFGRQMPINCQKNLNFSSCVEETDLRRPPPFLTSCTRH